MWTVAAAAAAGRRSGAADVGPGRLYVQLATGVPPLLSSDDPPPDPSPVTRDP